MSTLHADTYPSRLQRAIADGWVMVSEGPSGAQLRKPKRMRFLDKCALVVGVLTLIFYGLGLIFILLAVLDYAFLTKEETQFLAR